MELKIINNQEVMNKDFKLGLVMQPNENGATRFGSGGSSGSLEDAPKREVKITDSRDSIIAHELMEEANNGNHSADRHLADILKKYDQIAAGNLLINYGYAGEGWETIGDCFDEESLHHEALDAYKESAEAGFPCGKCKLGCYYAEGKGCRKNMALAKKWIEEAAQECPDAVKYLDEYGLR